MTTDDMANEVIERLTPKVKVYTVHVERKLSMEFTFEIEADSKNKAEDIAEEMARDEGTYGFDEEIHSWIVPEQESSGEINLVDPNQINIFMETSFISYK